MPLQIIIVGAGIGGLCAAIALRQAGHCVKIFEKSRFASEIGAALALSPNGSHVLSRLGFSFVRARACTMERWDTMDGISLAQLASIDLRNSEANFGMPFMTVGRIDLHEELLRLALSEEGVGEPVKLVLSSKVVAADSEEGAVELENCETHRGDLIVGADGLHSVLKKVVVGENDLVAASTGMSAFRFSIPTATVLENEMLALLLHSKAHAVSIMADTQDTVNERHMVWYECQGGDVQNLVGIHPTQSGAIERTEGFTEKSSMLEEFGHFHPHLLELIKLAPTVTRWPLSLVEPLDSWTKGRVVIIGDAAHPMLPFGGQGSNQAMEDGGALGHIFRGVSSPSEIPQKLKLFERVRIKRASRVQILSSVRVGKEETVEDKLKVHADPPGSDVPISFTQRTQHDFGFDIFARCEAVMD